MAEPFDSLKEIGSAVLGFALIAVGLLACAGLLGMLVGVTVLCARLVAGI